MYRDNRREGSCSIGANTPATDYFLAEGTTAWGFTTYLLVQNPNPVANNVRVELHDLRPGDPHRHTTRWNPTPERPSR